MTPRERELMHGMVNCYHVCHGTFDETIGMVGSARGLTSQEVKRILEHIKLERSEEYRELRQRLPEDFPL